MLRLRPAAALLGLGAAILASAPALADEPRYNQVSLRAEVDKEVPRDLMEVTLYTEAQDSDPAKLAKQVTEALNKALGQARQVKNIDVRQGSRNSFPIYDDKGQKITGWRERAEVRLESADFAALSQLTGEMLTDLKMDSMNFAISSATRKTSEDALIKDAVAAFKSRAELVTQAMGGQGYKVVNLNLNTTGSPQPFLPAPAPMSMKLDRAEAAVTPDVEAGTAKVSVTANGTIEVQIP
ncbi:SIMPL domain-containing protein [Pseudomonas sp. DTU_2021_1001937_2_SI_NGA_ILE_001]|uniref:SIMPL domain-containing protein n=1 Tax=Pseudomonas sp. DTU_2021_1001937_2_SI_NGA_ILE_001 TaxID=3077589 RepID=UPI0025D676DE|nr:SIMPL domain-containing protein [Pseudomonas sp. DTU_2021_1001937_2_SI_NGA_ILE_001]WNW11916.1 SIMPL domain-containing protein [Pseudomonas sp. DTU_2021_1001937_2_SI_NGA_ILE_001]